MQIAAKGIKAGQSPFGAVIVKNGRVIACAHNAVWKNRDITAHAEMLAIRRACKKMKTIDLSGCVLYSTCEPCPMCFSAIHWAKIAKIVYGIKIRDAHQAGFNELSLSCAKLKQLGKSPVRLMSGFLRNENLEIFRQWLNKKNRRTY